MGLIRELLMSRLRADMAADQQKRANAQSMAKNLTNIAMYTGNLDLLKSIKPQIEDAYPEGWYSQIESMMKTGSLLDQMATGMSNATRSGQAAQKTSANVPQVGPRARQLLGIKTPEPGLTAAMTRPTESQPLEYLKEGAPVPPEYPPWATRPVPKPRVELKSLSPTGPTWGFSNDAAKAASVNDMRQAYDFIVQTNPKIDPEDAWAKAFDFAEEKYGFIPPPEAMKVVEPDFKVARNKRAYGYMLQGVAGLLQQQGVKGDTVSEVIANATPALKNQAFTAIAQSLASKGLADMDNEDFRRLVLGDAFMAQRLKERYIGKVGDVLAQEEALGTTELSRLDRIRREEETKAAAREKIRITGSVAPALEILANLNELLDGRPLTDKDGVPLRNEKGDIIYEPPLLPQQGGWNRFWTGLQRYGQALWQSDEIGVRTAAYLAQRKAFLSFIVRTFGEKGMLTEGDIKRIADTLPSMFTTQAVKMRNMNSMNRILKNLVDRSEKLERAPANEVIIRNIEQGMRVVNSVERGFFADSYHRATGETLRDEDIDALQPRKVIEYDVNGNEIAR